MISLQALNQSRPKLPVNPNITTTRSIINDVQQPLGNPQSQEMQMQNTPQYGLAGAESALQGGTLGGINALNQANARAQAQIGGSAQALGQGYNLANQNMMAGLGFVDQNSQRGINALTGYNDRATESINDAIGRTNDIFSSGISGAGGMFQQAADAVSGFKPAGLQAQQHQMALSGLLGQRAFDNALMDNPATKFLQEEAQRAVLNNASATGGLKGGDVMRALQDRATGLAAQDLQNQYARAGGITDQGLRAAGMQGDFLARGGSATANLVGQQANANARLIGQLADMQNSTGMGISNLLQNSTGQQLNMLGQGMNNAMNTGNSMADLGRYGAGLNSQLGINVGNLLSSAGNRLADYRDTTGRLMASNIGSTGAGLSSLINSQGSGLSDIYSNASTNMANLINTAGENAASRSMSIAQLLSNISTGQGSQLAEIAGYRGGAGANAALRQGENYNDVIDGLLTAYYLRDLDK